MVLHVLISRKEKRLTCESYCANITLFYFMFSNLNIAAKQNAKLSVLRNVAYFITHLSCGIILTPRLCRMTLALADISQTAIFRTIIAP
jgi:hypothetical protein